MTEPQKKKILVNLADFTTRPGGRYKADHRVGSKGSAEEFREEALEPAFLKAVEEGDTIVVVNFEGIMGVTASYLEEVFGGMTRKYGMEAVTTIIHPEAEKPHHQTWVEEANRFIAEEGARQAGDLLVHEFVYHLARVLQRFSASYTRGIMENPDEFPRTKKVSEWMEQFRAFEVTDDPPDDEEDTDEQPTMHGPADPPEPKKIPLPDPSKPTYCKATGQPF